MRVDKLRFGVTLYTRFPHNAEQLIFTDFLNVIYFPLSL